MEKDPPEGPTHHDGGAEGSWWYILGNVVHFFVPVDEVTRNDSRDRGNRVYTVGGTRIIRCGIVK